MRRSRRPRPFAECRGDTGNKSKEAEALIVMGGAQLDLEDLGLAAQSVVAGMEVLCSSIRASTT